METGKHLNEYGDILTVKELAQYLDCCTHTVYNLLRKRKLKGKRIGKEWVITKSAIEKFLEI